MSVVVPPKTLAQLSDVVVTVSVDDGQVLTYRSSDGSWVPADGTPGPAGPQGEQGLPGDGAGAVLGVPVSAIGIVPGTDFSATLQADFNSRSPAAVHYIFDATGTTPYRYSDPTYLDRPGCGVSGGGRGATVLQSLNGRTPPFVFGLRQTETPGATPQVVSSAHRPDAFGKLHSSIAPSPGAWSGFCTRGGTAQRCYVVLPDGPPTCGVIKTLPSGRDFDNFGFLSSTPALTVQACIEVVNGLADMGTSSHSIVGLGASSGPGPWWFGMDESNNWMFSFCTINPTTKVVTHRIFRGIPNATGPGLHRPRAWVNLVTEAYGMSQNGSPLTLTGLTAMTGFAGEAFYRNDGRYSCWVGPSVQFTMGQMDTPVPFYTIWGLNVRNDAVTTEPADDAARYVCDPDHSVWAMDGTHAALTRTFHIKCGNNQTAVDRHCGYIIPCGGSDGGIKGNFARDFTVDGGGVMLAQNLDFRALNLDLTNTFIPFNLIPLNVLYPVDVAESRLAGWVLGIRMVGATPVRLRNVDVGGGGLVAQALFYGCDVQWTGGIGEFFYDLQEWFILAAGGQTGGSYAFRDLFPSSEAGVFSRGCIGVETLAQLASVLEVSNVKAGQIGAAGALVDLISTPGGLPGVADIRGLSWYDATGTSAAVRFSVDWAGRTDLRNNRIQRTVGTKSADMDLLTN